MKMKKELLSSKKDDAELAMIVDLERNDLGRVCNYSTVKVTEKKELEEHPTVYHLAATVEGELHSQYDTIDLIKATFPGGSITGAPKIRAMQVIDELEPTRRNVYTGAIGYIGFNGNIDLNIAIRTFLVKDDHVYFQVGGGIVADSNPEEEYEETLHKAKALIDTLE
jgi:para-aminobenzoate synthetase component 1